MQLVTHALSSITVIFNRHWSYDMDEWSYRTDNHPDSKVHGANMGPIWGRQDPDGPHVGPMNFVIRDG